jgi:hypothetical protein
MPVDPVYLWFLPLCFFIAQGAMGASVARHSLRPLLIPRVKFLTNSGTMSRENANVCSPSFQSATRTLDAELRIGEFRDSGFKRSLSSGRASRGPVGAPQ